MMMLIRALFYGLLGLVVENVFTGVSAVLAGDIRAPTRSYLWMPVAWALGGLGFEALIPVISHLGPYWLRGLGWTAAIYGLEFLFGALLRVTIGVVPWDYRHRTRGAALWGTINWRYLPYWLVLGLFVEPIHGFVARLASALGHG